MIVYHPIQDAYHCSLRLITISLDGAFQKLEWERIRLIDFYVALPHLLAAVRLPSEYRSAKKLLKDIPLPYESLLSPARLFFHLEEIQKSAASLLTASRLIDRELFQQGQFQIRESKLLNSVEEISQGLNFRNEAWYRFLLRELGRYPMHGKNGLKHRTGIMEFRHDPL